MIKEVTEKLNNNIMPDKTELTEAFDEIYSGIADEILAVSFITLLNGFLKSGNGIDIIDSAIKSANGAMKRISLNLDFTYAVKTTEIEDNTKYFDISFVRDVMLSSNNIPVVKYSTDYNKNNENILNKLNITPYKKNENGEFDTENIEKTNYYYIKPDESESYLKYSNNISKKLCFKNILNITDKMLNPCMAKNIVIGVDNIDKVEKTAKLCLNLNYTNSIVVSSKDNTPFVSPGNESYIAEAWKNKIFAYKLTPELVDMPTHPIKELESENINHNIETITELFKGNLKNSAVYDTAVINTALALYIVKKADSVMEGIKIAKNTIDSGLAKEKFEELKNN